MVNITINYPHIYEKNIQKLIKMEVILNRSEAVRTAIGELLIKEVKNLELLGFWEE